MRYSIQYRLRNKELKTLNGKILGFTEDVTGGEGDIESTTYMIFLDENTHVPVFVEVHRIEEMREVV